MKLPVVVLLVSFTVCLCGPVRRDTNPNKLDELKTKLDDLRKVLDNIEEDIRKEGHPKSPAKNENSVLVKPKPKENQKRTEVPKVSETVPESKALKTFEEQLSPDDVALIKRMSSKVKYLEQALKDQEKGVPQEEEKGLPDLPPAPVAAADKRDMEEEDPVLKEYISHLSPEDQKLVRKLKSNLHYLKTALETPGGNEGEAEEAPVAEKRAQPQDEDPKLDSFLETLTPEDVQMLKKMKSRIEYLKEALKHEDQDTGDGEQPKQETKEGQFGNFPEKKEFWDDKPLPPAELGVKRGLLPSEKCKDNKRCGPGEDVEAEVEERFLKDVAFAKANGVSVDRLLRNLKARKAAKQVTQEENELEKLTKED